LVDYPLRFSRMRHKIKQEAAVLSFHLRWPTL